MYKKRFLLIFALLTVAANVRTTPAMAWQACQGMDTEAKVKHIAKKVVQEQLDKNVGDCYNSLADENKAKVFEAIAVERGISVEKLRKEADENAKNRQDVDEEHDEHVAPNLQAAQAGFNKQSSAIRPMTHAGSFWRQLVERIPFSALFKPLLYPYSSYQDALCDGDPNDVDYMFNFEFSFNVNNPDSLRTFSYHVGVDSMLAWYQLKYGGVDGRGYTDRPGVRICLGDNGVATAGGEATVRSWLALHY